ncbi:HlyD family type I secretion periplasmic adaptor subunit [Dongia rigui]|uniref:Membrane fusion protein (MFP) family protein n=1 Tax=Dongia rigui TaxID=940149 RepID=A0ABU5DW30_9PROT|nr:HlyD family type I secretion periplasmic adaptor subunit [Dongia rigui]MDY0870918.1 HlyD family type I secretion periplasmic adaptor subunit [Dongia rigui]
MSVIELGHPGLTYPEPSLRRYVMMGIAVVIMGFGGFLLWGLLSSLDRAAIADGTVVVDSNKKSVQHLEGGIVKELLVRDGDQVKAGDVLLRIDTTQVQAQISQLHMEHYSRLARIARLTAEQEGKREIQFPAELLAAQNDPAVLALMASQRALLNARFSAYDEGVGMRERKIGESQNEIAGLKSQIGATEEMRVITEKQLVSIRELYKKGLTEIPRLRGLESSFAELGGRLGELRSSIARSSETIAGLKIEIENLRSTRATEVNGELQQVLMEGTDYEGRLAALQDVLGRMDVRAPQGGRIVNMQVFGPGAVIEPGKPILDIVPQDDALVVEAKVKTDDIDSVHAGLKAEVKLLAFKQRRVPGIAGEVVTVSADRVVEERSGVAYYIARVKLDLSSLPPGMNVTPYPGMPAEVLIATGPRRAIDYFTSPLTDTWHRAFREE